jgi:hypothetical protein
VRKNLVFIYKQMGKTTKSSTATHAAAARAAAVTGVASSSGNVVKKRSHSSYAGIKTPVNIVHRIIKKHTPQSSSRFGTKDRIYAAAVLEGFMRDAISVCALLAGRTAQDKPRIIMGPHVQAALNDSTKAYYRLFPLRVGGVHTVGAAAAANDSDQEQEQEEEEGEVASDASGAESE